MKGVWVLFAVCAAAVMAAGCISVPGNTEEPLVGTWIAHDYTTATGVHYIQIEDTYFANFTGIERMTLDNGRILEWDLIWIKNGSTYIAYYQPFTMEIYPDGKRAKLNAGAGISNWIMARSEGSGVVGDWHLVDAGFGEGNITGDATFFIYNNGSSLLVSYLQSVEPYIQMMEWTEIGQGMIVHTPSKPVHLYLSDGKLCDNFGVASVRV